MDIDQDAITARDLTIEELGAEIGQLRTNSRYLQIRLTRAEHRIEELKTKLEVDAEEVEDAK